MDTETKRPEIVTDEHIVFLVELRESGVTNMWGAGAYVEAHFEVSKQHSNTICSWWMNNGPYTTEDLKKEGLV